MITPSTSPWRSIEVRKVLLALAEVWSEKFDLDAERREATSRGQELALTLYVSPKGKATVCVEWQSDATAGRKLAEEVRRALRARDTRRWRLSQRRWNRIYIE